MEVELKVGARLDFVSPDEMQSMLREQADRIGELLANAQGIPALDTKRSARGVADATGVALVVVPGPPAGWKFYVRSWLLTTQDGANVAGGRAFAYIMADPGPNAGTVTVEPFNQVDFTNSVPDVATWSSGELVIGPGEALVFRVTGAAASQAFFANLQTEMVPARTLMDPSGSDDSGRSS